MSEAGRAVIRMARNLVRQKRWQMELPPDRPLPGNVEAALERAIAALDAAEAAAQPQDRAA